ncbi:MAG: DUF3656 domain-containing protein, partial [Anaerolineales bacterium]|nr:DUF3656 domain-containing protein [Anaerolineales bacterium]
EQLGRLGGTPYELADLTAEVSGRPFAPSSLLNQLRRQAVAQLQDLQEARAITVNEPLAVLAEVMGKRREGDKERGSEFRPTPLAPRPSTISNLQSPISQSPILSTS